MVNLILKAEKREITGRKVKRMRKEGILPGNIYGKNIKSVSLMVKEKDFEDMFKKVGETSLLQIELGKEKRPVLVHNVQMDPLSDKPIHVDFLQVDLKEKVTAEVPVELVGESPAEKQGLGTVVQYIQEIEVEALPTDLPDKFEVDISNLIEVDNAVFVKDLKVDKKKIEIKNDMEVILVKVEAIKEEVEEVPVAPVPEAGEGEVPVETPEGETVEKEEAPAPEKEEEKKE
ncbi:hypothetical protein A2W13_01280 [Candidatus Woesebacteria bacterium RBG_16_36_11]|uniref:Large ribosomal subunit protein bL25 n=3 Tax=Candidatus Woeseibacteriota TaxID=1752722 RepID=A0A1F7XBW7_9BACT|nr:MAG: hypothetical protein A2Z67_03285 [Candidatus Woesebacteria bacterium RBG_13_36_22]OGM12259.1 MAG: hypothetical protein A2W13_01280 [Candidatus Woesebacteria bacterium RBG_16_36_11]OGM16323.1 MAG: hypothetical protein A2V55_01235 [Candidatus Woesebacteria bacterium RBG_19FT_COMBO_37_29]